MDEFERRSLRLKRTVINEKIDFTDNLFTELKVKGLLDKDMVELIQVSLGVGMWRWEVGLCEWNGVKVGWGFWWLIKTEDKDS